MTSFRCGIDIVAKDADTRDLLSRYQATAPVMWLGGGDSVSTAGSSTGTNAASSAAASSASSATATGMHNQQEDWQAFTNQPRSHDDMCAYDWIQSRMKGGVEWFYPKGTTTHVQGQFVMEQEGRATLEPSPVYGMHLQGEQTKFGHGMYQ